MTLIAYLFLSQGVPIYTNYDLSFPQFQHLIKKLSISELLELEIDEGVILIDEVYTIAESRISTAKINRFFSYFVFQSRKRKVHIVYTAQLSSSVDLRLFDLTDRKIACFGDKNGKIKFKMVYDNDGKTKTKKFSISRVVFEDYVFNFYDSWQPIDSLGIQDLVVEIEKFEYQKINKRVDEACEKILKRYQVDCKKLTKYNIDNMLLRLGLPLALSSYVYARLKTEQTGSIIRRITDLNSRDRLSQLRGKNN